MLLALDAQVVVASSRRKRKIALAEFYSGPHQTVLNGELLEEVDYPRVARRRALGLVISKARTHGDGYFPGERGGGIAGSTPAGASSGRASLWERWDPLHCERGNAEELLLGNILNEDLLTRVGEAVMRRSAPSATAGPPPSTAAR